MQWWGWLIIWATLFLVLLGTLTAFAISLFLKVKAVAIELAHLAAQAERLDQADLILDDQKREIAILTGYLETQRRRERVRNASRARRLAHHNERIGRARSLIAVDASKRSWFVTPDRSKAL
jgi:hypothetical protein